MADDPEPIENMPSPSEGGPGANSGAPDKPEHGDVAATSHREQYGDQNDSGAQDGRNG